MKGGGTVRDIVNVRQLALPLAAQLLIDTHGGAAYGLVALSDLVSDRFRWSLVIGNTCSRTHFVLARQAKHLPHEQSVDSILQLRLGSLDKPSLFSQAPESCWCLLRSAHSPSLHAPCSHWHQPSSSQIDLCDIGRQALTDDPPHRSLASWQLRKKNTDSALTALSLSLSLSLLVWSSQSPLTPLSF